MKIKGNENAAKKAICMPGMVTTRLPTEYYPSIKKTKDLNVKKKSKTSIIKLLNIKLHIEEWKSTNNSYRQYVVKLSRLHI